MEHNTGMGLWCITGERVFAGALPTSAVVLVLAYLGRGGDEPWLIPRDNRASNTKIAELQSIGVNIYIKTETTREFTI